MTLQEKVAIITGGADGIGKATALRFAKGGAKVVVADVNETAGEEVVNEIESIGGQALFKRTDVAKFEEVEALVQATVDTYGTVDVMFNNAGIGVNTPFLEHSVEDYEKVVAVNQHGVFYGMQAAAKKMKELGVQGVIINNASVFGFTGTLGVTGYQAAKGAVVMLTKHGALELAPYGIRVVGVGPGGVDTNIVQGYRDAGLLEYMERQQLRRKLIKPEEVANVVAFLASDEGNVMNGTVVMADDGFSVFKSDIRP
ncbi:short-chain dehydrogenase [Pontibacillus halophilus JSM 076056 = DSM 19796]|uniref:Short-chain dehydrogenase n=1 Tax=Pontibacillus halophilus JSM 076056 = DSM 19796 TaxID=1385510 RepID=A0A0A5GFH4_9BACI|nr:SDR family oxidoreductase [Pontibacillus halophilus]KGX91966.1 short-chain dehydrogenase [Pontibacillus halophilus JSM 076056 = DSM 19796]